MSDEKNKPLTPEQAATQQQTADDARIKGNFVATDVFQRITEVVGFGSDPGGIFGKTSFENAQLNAMIDLLENSNPAELEGAGDALVKAKAALNAAAKELGQQIDAVDWKGEAATEFGRYGSDLVKYAYSLGTFANAVGQQMRVASEGLTSVRNSKPPRDNRLIQKQAKDFALPERTQDNPEYVKALKVEQDRQEAINQMNRLASFYAVSEESLLAQEPPKFPEALKAAVPPPSDNGGGRRVDSDAAGSGGAAAGAASPTTTLPSSEVGGGRGVPRTDGLGTAPPVLEPDTRTEINTVKTPPAPPVTPGPAPVVPPNAGPPNPTNPPVLPPLGPPNLVGRDGPRGRGPSDFPRTGRGPVGPTVTGRSDGPGRTPSGYRNDPTATGRQNPVGRPTGPTTSGPTTGRQGPVGRPTGPMTSGPATGRTAGPNGQGPITGRQGTPGQPAYGRTPPSTTGGPRTARSAPIVGGTPQRPTTGSAGSRIPRGTVIGAEGAAQGRASAARPSQSGVIGANPGNRAQRPTGRGTPSTNGVVGTPRKQQSRDEEQERGRSVRPDYLTEDEETWASRRRGAVPPVID
ncbi:hypothetical protein [Streptomyces sp. NPDC000410]|uniref:hypothetical protein n=1 Tax=Streptomyces sp. NPDC000410 TaxID=3154254 RepID=UPI00331A0AF0